ncbi:hypothetical protein AZKH_1991 [Azoarcus sp. KH32C]|nr:hypothetical protein AZKH_1991 [Azoarcus sp. KH32C]
MLQQYDMLKSLIWTSIATAFLLACGVLSDSVSPDGASVASSARAPTGDTAPDGARITIAYHQPVSFPVPQGSPDMFWNRMQR